ncbi:MAG: dihydrolipoyllysine-residue acetyltransferase [Gammaproteobacteria bacterium]|nr:dihydrolipoyllysine-residue acetyltransferase [Gammaproteobacteria bacterium]
MSIKPMLLPDIGDFKGVDVIEILVKEGDVVAVDDALLVLESDKATMEIPSPMAGKIVSLKVKVGDKVATGVLIAEVEADESVAAVKTAAAPQPTSAPPVAVASVPVATVAPTSTSAPTMPVEKPINAPVAGAKAHASPSVRLFARELGVDLSLVTGTGVKGRISKDDVQAFVKGVMSGAKALPNVAGAAGGMGIPSIKQPNFADFGEIASEPLSRIKKISGKHLHACWLNVPHVTQFDECDITEMEAFRTSLKEQAKARGVGVTPLIFVIKAAIATLKKFPQVNASLSADGENLILKQYYHIGVAVDTPNGLMVPVIRDADTKSVWELAEALKELSHKAREGKLSPTDMSGATFSISSLGGIGGTQFTPIVNAPEVAILGVSKAKMQPVWNGSSFEPRLIMPFSMSYDHRVIDGAQGVRFTTYLGQMLTDIRQLLL